MFTECGLMCFERLCVRVDITRKCNGPRYDKNSTNINGLHFFGSLGVVKSTGHHDLRVADTQFPVLYLRQLLYAQTG
jgi:hypothetical protein